MLYSTNSNKTYMYIVHTKKGYQILYDKQIPPHKDLLRFISHIFANLLSDD